MCVKIFQNDYLIVVWPYFNILYIGISFSGSSNYCALYAFNFKYVKIYLGKIS